MAWQDRDYERSNSDGWQEHGQGQGFAHRAARLFAWSFSVGRYSGIDIRIHLSFLILVVFELLGTPSIAWSLRRMGLLFVSVLLHEVGHCIACRRVGGTADQILMWPLGGLASCDPPNTPRAHLLTAIWGPMVNVLLMAFCFGALVTLGAMNLGNALFPLGFWADPTPWGLRSILQDLYVVNWMLLLFNLLLVYYPFDGGRIIHAALWFKMGFRRSLNVACIIGMVGAVISGILFLFMLEIFLLILPIFGFLYCFRQRKVLKQMEAEGQTDEAEYDLGIADYSASLKDDDEISPKRDSMWQRWRRERLQRRVQREQQQRARMEAEVDAILAKVKATGLASLTSHERHVLHRATEMQRHNE